MAATWLHVKSHYSLGVGTASVSAIVEQACATGVQAVALTDLENLYGQVELHRTCRARSVRAITGIELREHWAAHRSFGTKRGRLVLLARDRTGYSNLCRIVHARRSSSEPTPAPLETLERVGDLSGLLILTDDPRTLVPAVRIATAENVRALLVRPGSVHPEPELSSEARRYGVREVASCEGIFLDPTESELHRLLVAAHLASDLRKSGASIEAGDRILRSSAELRALFADRPEALAEAEWVAASSVLDLSSPAPSRHEQAGEERANQELTRLCEERLRARFAERSVPAAYDERLAFELDIIGSLQQSRYFLAVGEVVARARRTQIPLVARGSSVASLVVYLLGASPVDPVAQSLVFERFLHPRRHALPDVDLDVASTLRDSLIQWVRRRFGHERVAQVSALQTYQRRSAYRDGLKVLGAGRDQIERFLARLPSDELLDAGRASMPHLALPEPLRAKLPLIERLVGKPRHQSVHPAGVVIAEHALAAMVPLERAAKGACITQYGADDVQAAGFSKLDLLGNHALDEIAETFEWLAGRSDSFARALTAGGADAIPSDDVATFRSIEAGTTVGCFQLETPAVRRVLTRVPIRSLDDVTAALAIVRPGPASGQAKRAFIRRARGAEPASYWHAAFRDTLEATYGLLLYEEDIALVLATLAGLDLSTADELRELIQERADDLEWLAEVRRGLLRRACARGFDEPAVDRVWRDVRRFAAYSFNKAHATSYALLAYRTAYLKTHAPVEFGCALLNHHAGAYPKRSIGSELVRQKVSLLPPSVQWSTAGCSVEQAPSGRVIRIGLALHKHLRRATLARILRERRRADAFQDLADFLWRVAPNARELEALVWSGACDELAPLSAHEYPWFHAALLARLASLRDSETSYRTLRAALAALPAPEARGRPEQVALFRRLSRVHHELDTLQMHVSDHPIRLLRDEASRQGCVRTVELRSRVGQRVRLAAVVAATRKTPARDGGVIQFVTFEDEHGLVEATLVGEVLGRYAGWITTPGPFLVEGLVAESEGELELQLTWLLPFHLRDRPYSDIGSEPPENG